MRLGIGLILIVLTVSSCSTSTKRSEYCDYYTVKYFDEDEVKDEDLVDLMLIENETWYQLCTEKSLTKDSK